MLPGVWRCRVFDGQDILDLAMTRVGQRYVLGARVHLANRNWSGPWDCAEFVAWAAFHAYAQLFAVRPPSAQTGESFSGWWHEDAVARGSTTTVGKALATPGAVLVRRPGDFAIRIGHVAISRGNGTTVEAHSARVGVAVLPNAAGRKWTSGVLIPGVAYAPGAAMTVRPPRGVLRLEDPFQRGPRVRAVQQALLEAGVDPGPIDGVFGQATAAAVAAYQAREGLLVDGEVGPQTAGSLGLA
jgi:hypothetical protein